MAPRILDKVVQIHRPPRQAKAGLPPGRTGGPGGQPPFRPTDEQRAKVKRLVACGFTVDSISVVIGVPSATLERHFKTELQHGKLLTDATILDGIARQAVEGDKTFSIFWAKARAGWRDVGKDVDGNNGSTVFSINISNSGGSGPTIEHEPDNSMRISVTHRLAEPEEET